MSPNCKTTCRPGIGITYLNLIVIVDSSITIHIFQFQGTRPYSTHDTTTICHTILKYPPTILTPNKIFYTITAGSLQFIANNGSYGEARFDYIVSPTFGTGPIGSLGVKAHLSQTDNFINIMSNGE